MYYIRIIFLLLGLVLAGCWSPERSGVATVLPGPGPQPDPDPDPDPVVTGCKVGLDFALLGGGAFPVSVDQVQVAVFDRHGAPYMEPYDLARGVDGMDITLPPGTYRLVFWGNIGEGTKVENGVVSSLLGAGNVERLYYGPCVGTRSGGGTALPYFELVVPDLPTMDVAEPVLFTNAYRSVEFYIEGWKDGEPLPTVDIEGLPAGLNYSGMGAVDGTVVQSQSTHTVVKDGVTYAVATFYTLRFDDLEGIDVVIRKATGEAVATTSLERAAAQGQFDLTDMEAELILYVDFVAGTVDITLPNWGRQPIW